MPADVFQDKGKADWEAFIDFVQVVVNGVQLCGCNLDKSELPFASIPLSLASFIYTLYDFDKIFKNGWWGCLELFFIFLQVVCNYHQIPRSKNDRKDILPEYGESMTL